MSGLPIRPSFQDLSPDGSLSEPRHQKQQTWYTRINMKSLFLGTMSNTSWSSWISNRYCAISGLASTSSSFGSSLKGPNGQTFLEWKAHCRACRFHNRYEIPWYPGNMKTKGKWSDVLELPHAATKSNKSDLAFGFSDRPSTSLGEKIMEPWKPSCIGSWI